MSRLIDADALEQNMKFSSAHVGENHLIYFPWVDIVKSINVAPTVDAVPVVRCKDCISWAGGHCVPLDINTNPDEFCSKAFPYKEGRQ